MLLSDTDREQTWEGAPALESPFLETSEIKPNGHAPGFADFAEGFSPFAITPGAELAESEANQLLAEALDALHEESFNEALAFLAEETEQAVADRFASEAPGLEAERERYGDLQLSEVRFAAEQYLDALSAGLAGQDLASLSDEQLESKLDQFDPETGDLTPAGEEFIGGLIRKAKSVVKFVGKAASSVGKIAGAVLGPVLNRLKGLIRPLLKRVLAFAIGRLPAPLQPAARLLADRFQFEGEDAGEATDEAPMSPANLADLETLADEFDASLAEAFLGDGSAEAEQEAFDQATDEADGRQLERLAEARGALIDSLEQGDEARVGPAVEQFVPALLGALRLGINLVGRPKVVGFLAGYLAKLIGRWVGPQLSRPLSSAIVDTGLRLVTLEAADEAEALAPDTAPVALAGVVEDTVRRLAEQESYIFENEDLTQLAAAEAFSQAVATHFPPQYVRPDLRQAASLGGAFVVRRPRSVRSYRKYSRAPEIEITPQIADALPSFGGSTVGGALRAAGVALPMRARMHIFQSSPGTTLASLARADRSLGNGGRGYAPVASFHPLTPAAAGLLLREPGLGVAAPSAFLRSPRRIAVGQRFYVLQPTGAGAAPAMLATSAGRAAMARLAPSSGRLIVHWRRGRITVSLFFSEAEAQRIAQLIRAGRGPAVLLQALVGAYRTLGGNSSGPLALREDSEAFEERTPRGPRPSPAVRALVRRRLRTWVLPALAEWAKTHADDFARAAAHPDAGVTVRIRLSSVPGLAELAASKSPPGEALRGAPAIAIAVEPGRHRR